MSTETKNERYEKLCQELYGMSLEKFLLLNRHFDKRADYISGKIIALSRLLNKECDGLKSNEEELLLSKVHAATLNKSHKLDDKRHGEKKFLESK